MSSSDTADADVSEVLATLERVADKIVAGLHCRFSALSDIPLELEALRASLLANSTSFLSAYLPDYSDRRARGGRVRDDPQTCWSSGTPAIRGADFSE